MNEACEPIVNITGFMCSETIGNILSWSELSALANEKQVTYG